MANTIAGFGALDFMHQGGSQRTEELRQVWILSSDPTPIFYGDIVQQPGISAVSTANQNQGFGPYITQGCSAVTTGGIAPLWGGVFRGCELFTTVLSKMYYSRYWPGQSAAGTSSLTGDIKAYIVSDLSARFIIQASSQNVLGSSNIGMVANIAIGGTVSGVSTATGGGNTATGNSGMQLSATSPVAIASTSTSAFAFKIVDFYSNWGPGLLPGQVPGLGTAQFVNGMDNTTAGQYVIVQPNAPTWFG